MRAGQPFLMLKGKGGKERLAPVSTRAAAAVAKWLTVAPPDSVYLFPGGKGHLSRVRARVVFNSCLTEAQVPA